MTASQGPWIVWWFDRSMGADTVVGTWQGTVKVPELFDNRQEAMALASSLQSGRVVALREVLRWW